MTRPVPAGLLLLLLALSTLVGGIPAPDPIRLTVRNATQGPAGTNPAFVTIVGRDGRGRFCHLDRYGRFLPCVPEDNRVVRNGRAWCAYALPLGETLALDLDRGLRVDGGRIYLSVGKPTYLRVDEATGGLVEPDPANPEDPNGPLCYDWIEFALDAAGFHGNPTCVDQFGLPVTLAVTDRRRPGLALGPVGIARSRAEVLRAWETELPEPFRSLEDPAGRRILAPAHAPGFQDGPLKEHFARRVADLWRSARTVPLVLTPEEGRFTGRVGADDRLVFTREGRPEVFVIDGPPSSAEVFRCDGVLARGNGTERVLGAQLGALLNRNVADPLAWRDATSYYLASPCNRYARFWHEQSLDGKAYGFAYDDVNDQSPSLATAEPAEITVTVRWD